MRPIKDPAELDAYRAQYVATLSASAIKIKAKVGQAVAWVWTDEESRLRAIAWLGRSMHPYSGRHGVQGCAYRFKTEASRAAWIGGLIERAAAEATRKTARSAEKAEARAKPHDLQVGDVLRSSWGYDQTNIDYYEVTRLVGSQMVEYREIACQSQETASMQGDSVPAPGRYVGEAKRARVSDYGKRDSIKVSSCANAYKVHPRIIGGIKVFNTDHWTAYA